MPKAIQDLQGRRRQPLLVKRGVEVGINVTVLQSGT